jgi:Condensation domain.
MSSTEISGNHQKPYGECADNEARLSRSCFPSFSGSAGDHERQMSTTLNLQQTKHLQTFVSNSSYDIPQILRAAWALVLRCYTGSDNVCFGYEEINDLLTGGRNKSDDKFMVRLKLEDDVPLSTVVERAGDGSIVRADSNCSRDSRICHTAENVAYNTVFLFKNPVTSQFFNKESAVAHPTSVVVHPAKVN